MSSSATRRRQASRAPRSSQASGWRRPVIWSVLVITTVWSIAAAAYLRKYLLLTKADIDCRSKGRAALPEHCLKAVR